MRSTWTKFKLSKLFVILIFNGFISFSSNINFLFSFSLHYFLLFGLKIFDLHDCFKWTAPCAQCISFHIVCMPLNFRRRHYTQIQLNINNWDRNRESSIGCFWFVFVSATNQLVWGKSNKSAKDLIIHDLLLLNNLWLVNRSFLNMCHKVCLNAMQI